jgi:hypothetical protein
MIRSLILVALLAVPAASLEPATIGLSKLKDAKLRFYGFLETDVIADTRQGFSESQANTLVPRDAVAGVPNFAGRHHRMQMSVRQTRIGVAVSLPEASGWSPEGVLEMDFYGNNAPNTMPGATPGAQTERDFFNNPAARVRHAYLNVTNGGLNLKAGQYWSLFGWQTEYFPPEITVQSTVGQLNSRLPQLRATYTKPLGPDLAVQGAAALGRPSQMNSASPVYQVAARLSSSRWMSAVNGGFAGPIKELSAGISLEIVPLQTDGKGNPAAAAVAFDVLIPIIPSFDGKSAANNLAFIGEMVSGSGIGGTELTALNFGVAGPTAAQVGTAIDQGVAGVNSTGNLEPIRVRTFRGALSYTLPNPKWAVAAGYAQVEGRNLDRFSTPAAAAAIAPKLQYGFANATYAPVDWLRLGAQASQARDTYNDAASRFAINNRLQFSVFFVF